MEVFFEKEEWSIVEVDPRRWWSNWSTVSHKCGKHWWARNPHDQEMHPRYLMRNHKCSFCDEDIPEGIEALWTMHNWDNIQEQSGFYMS